MDNLILLSFANNLVELWHGLFMGDRRYFFLMGFAIISFGVPFLLTFLSAVYFEIYAFLHLKKIDPEGWKRFWGAQGYWVYKKWLRGEHDPDDIFCKTWHKYDKFGKVCLLIWFIVFILVAVTVVIVDKFNLQF